MRALTFKGYLLSQLQELSGVGGTSLYSFSKLAENNFRLKDALCLYLMMFTDKNLKNKLLKSTTILMTVAKNFRELRTIMLKNMFPKKN